MYNKQREIIPTRQLEIKLSEEDVRKITSKAGELGMTVAELIEHFIGDLVDGTYTSGSDERACADYWLERCGFGRFSDTFLQYLFENQILEDVLEAWDDMDQQESKEQLDEYWNGYIQQMRFGAFSTFDEEMEKVLKWREERKRLLKD